MDSAAAGEPKAAGETPIGIDYADRDLRGRDFSHESLQNANFSGADLRGCSFWNSDLSNANFQSAQIGIAPERVSSLLITGLFSALGYSLLIGLGEWGQLLKDVPNLTRGDKQEEDSLENEKYLSPWNLVAKSNISILLICTLPTGLMTFFGCALLFLGYVSADSIGEAYTIIASCLVMASGCLALAISQAQDLAKTDFSGAKLDFAQIDRSAFDQANTTETEIARVTWL
jgi:hypothetical protein